MTTKKIKEMLDACYQAKRIREMLPPLPQGVMPSYIQYLDVIQKLERQKGVLCGFVLIVLGIASGAMSKTTGGTDVQDFFSGILMGLSVAEILAGIWATGKKLLKQ